jgi:uncharacterized protein (DUF1697 family)
MPRYAAFLRGINVTGTRVTKEDLCAPFTGLGFENVTTFRASGNVVFDAPQATPKKLAAQIEQRLADDLGFTKAVTFIRTAAEMKALAALDPLPGKPEQKLQVLLLLQKPDKAVLDYATAEDQLGLGPHELFWLPKGRMTDSELDLKAIERSIGPTTMRTKGTIDQIAEKYFS